MNRSRALSLVVATALVSPVAVGAQPVVATPKPSARSGVVKVANPPAPQGFSVVLVLGEMQGTGATDTVPPAARKALADMKDFLPYKGYRFLDTGAMYRESDSQVAAPARVRRCAFRLRRVHRW